MQIYWKGYNKQYYHESRSIFVPYIQLMAQNQTDTGQSRLLALTPKRPLPKTVELKHVFSPDTTGTTGGEISCATTIPKFNLDLTFFTPAFVLGTDQNYYRLNQQFEFQKFIERRKQAQADLSNSNMDRVSPNQDFCQVCRQTYLDYTSHIVSATHRNRLKLSKAHKYIEDLCTSFQRSHLKREKSTNKKGKTQVNSSKRQPRKNKKIKESNKEYKNVVSQASYSLTFSTLPQKEGLH